MTRMICVACLRASCGESQSRVDPILMRPKKSHGARRAIPQTPNIVPQKPFLSRAPFDDVAGFAPLPPAAPADGIDRGSRRAAERGAEPPPPVLACLRNPGEEA